MLFPSQPYLLFVYTWKNRLKMKKHIEETLAEIIFRCGVLRVDRKFRSHGPRIFMVAYKKRVAVEQVFSRLKNLASLSQHNLKGLATYVSFLNSAFQSCFSRPKHLSTRIITLNQESSDTLQTNLGTAMCIKIWV